MLLGLNSLMQAVRIPSSRHNTSRKLIYNQNFAVLNHIVLVSEHQIVGPQGKDNIVLNLQILWIRQILDMEEILYLLHTVLCQVHHLVLFIYNKVPCLRDVLAHNGIQLGELAGGLSSHQLPGQHIADLIQLSGFAALAGYNKRSPGLVDQYGVHLIDNGKIQFPQHHLLFVYSHVIPKIIKSQFIVGHIGDIAGISLFPLLRSHGV